MVALIRCKSILKEIINVDITENISNEESLVEEKIVAETLGKQEPEKDTEEVKTKSLSEIKAIIENLLFVSSDPLPLNKIIKTVDDVNPEDITRALFELQLDYNNGNRGLRIQEIANGFVITTRSEYGDYIKKLYKQREKAKLSQAALETLAVIAYKQPIIRAEIESIRGVDSSVMIRNLIESGLIDIVGKKEVIGRPYLYGTTNLFLKIFGLRRLNDLPSIEELKKKIEKIEG